MNPRAIGAIGAIGAFRQALPRTCLASTSRLAVRHASTDMADVTESIEATASTTTGSSVAQASGFGTVAGRKAETAEIRRWRGKGFPRINSLQNRVTVHHPHLWNQGPFRPLTLPKRKSGGRDNTGSISVRHVGGGHKRRIRNLDFFRYYPGVHDVVRVEFDPGRSGHIALLRRRQGIAGKTEEEIEEIKNELAKPDPFKVPFGADLVVKSGWSYILAPEGLRAGDTVESFRRGVPDGIVEGWKNKLGEGEEITPRSFALLRSVVIKPGNVLPLYLIPPGTSIHNISFSATGKMKAVRSAGTSATVVAHNDGSGKAVGGTEVLKMGHHYTPEGRLTKANGHVLLRMVSGEVRKFQPGAVATIGTVSNKEHRYINLGKAGRSRRLGVRPTVRGVAMNAVDHPHGGGKSKSKGGKSAHSYTGKLTRGVRTRRPWPMDRNGNKMVVTQRPRGQHSGGVKKRK